MSPTAKRQVRRDVVEGEPGDLSRTDEAQTSISARRNCMA